MKPDWLFWGRRESVEQKFFEEKKKKEFNVVLCLTADLLVVSQCHCPVRRPGLNVAAARGNHAENIQSNLQNFHSVSSSVRAGKWVSATLTTPMPKGLHNAAAHNAVQIYAWVCVHWLLQELHGNSSSCMSQGKQVINSF